MTTNKVSFFIALLFILGACVEQVPYSSYHSIRHAKWEKEHQVTFDFDSLDVEHDTHYAVQLSIVHSSRYAYQNLSLVVEHNLVDTTMIADTLNLSLADKYGKWHGNVAAGLYHYNFDLYQHLLLDSLRSYRVAVSHFMKDDPLEGVEMVGLTIENSSKK